MNKKFSKTLLGVCLIAATLTLQGCTNQGTKDAKKEDSSAKNAGTQLTGKDYDPESGADGYANAGDNKESRYYKNPDFYNLKNDDTLTIIENFKTMQQTTEWSCGNVTALMVLENMKLNSDKLTEMDIAKSMKSSTDLDKPNSLPGSADNFGEYGTDVKQMYEFFSGIKGVKIVESSYIKDPKPEQLYSDKDNVPKSDVGNTKRTFESTSLYSSENKADTDKWVDDAKDSYFVKWLTGHLKKGRPVMVEWADWNGHWQAIIGYDNNGTPSIGDDTLIFADPYDTSDHSQDGYYVYPLERWFYMWHDRSVAVKPMQLQSYIVIEKQ